MTPNVLSIAGSDPSGGAGIQADLKTFAALGCHGMAAPTALTAQNTRGVSAVHLPPAAFVAEQIAAIFADIDVKAVKIGMLGSREIVEAVARTVAEHAIGLPIVLDPVLVATSGATLGDDAVIAAMRAHLFPLATLVTPNLAEAKRLGAVALASRAQIEDAAHALRGDGPAAWLIKGGHGGGSHADDLLLDDAGIFWLSSPRIATRNTHGTGCTLSAAIAAEFAKGLGLREAVAAAKIYVGAGERLAGADRLAVGGGPGPLDHFVRWRAPPS